MNLNDFTLAELHTAVSQVFAQMMLQWVQVRVILTSTEAFDAELSMRLTESMEQSMDHAATLLRDSLHKQGYTDQMIDDRIDEVKKLYGLE
jgi:hypothetical protein